MIKHVDFYLKDRACFALGQCTYGRVVFIAFHARIRD